MPGHARNSSRGAVPPLLSEQKVLVESVERPMLPRLAREPLVLGQQLDADGPPSLVDELDLLVGGEQEMLRPVSMSLGQCERRQSAGHIASPAKAPSLVCTLRKPKRQ